MKSKIILIGIIIILIVIIIANLTVLFLKKGESNKISSIDESFNDGSNIIKTNTVKTSKIAEDATLKNNNSIEQKENAEIIPTKNVDEAISNNVSKSFTQDTAKTVNTKETSNQLNTETKEENIVQSVEITLEPETSIEENNTQIETSPIVEETNVNNSVTPTQETSSVSVDTEEYRVNNSLINQMTNIINSNPSSLMKELGYSIVVDSSIVNETTGFTFTENRVKNAISYSFGTIRIYARDYYKNGVLMWNECFII